MALSLPSSSLSPEEPKIPQQMVESPTKIRLLRSVSPGAVNGFEELKETKDELLESQSHNQKEESFLEEIKKEPLGHNQKEKSFMEEIKKDPR